MNRAVSDLPAAPWGEDGRLDRRLFAVAAGLVLAVSAFHLLRLQPVTIDEPWIVDYFRVFWGGDRSWALSTTSQGIPKEPPLLWAYFYQWLTLGPFGISMATVRVQFVLTLLAAGFGFYFLLATRGVPRSTARWLALAFACDNVVGEAVRGGRLDPVAIAAGCLALGCWARAVGRRRLGWAALAGWAAAMAMFLWLTALIMAGILAVDWIADWRRDRRGCARRTLAMAGGATACAGVSLGFLWYRLGTAGLLLKIRLLSLQDPNVHWGNGVYEARNLLRFFGRSPAALLLLALAVALLVRAPGRALRAMAPFGATLGFALLLPPLYIWRLVYVVPALFLSLQAFLAEFPRWRRQLVAVLVVTSVAYTVVGRTWFAWHTREARDYGAFSQRLAAAIPDGSVVYSDYYWPFYYAGLEHGWRMFLCMQDTRSRLPSPAMRASFQYVVTADRAAFPAFLPRQDFVLVSTIPHPPPVLGREIGYGAAVYRRVGERR
jgi:hypothetical protein